MCVSRGGKTCYPDTTNGYNADVSDFMSGNKIECEPDSCHDAEGCTGGGYWCKRAKCLWHHAIVDPKKPDAASLFPGWLYTNAFKITRTVSAAVCPGEDAAAGLQCSPSSKPKEDDKKSIKCFSDKKHSCDCASNKQIIPKSVTDTVSLPCEVQWEWGLADYMKNAWGTGLEKEEDLERLEEFKAFEVAGRPADPGCENCLRKGPVWSFDGGRHRGHSDPESIFGDLQRSKRTASSPMVELEGGDDPDDKHAIPTGDEVHENPYKSHGRHSKSGGTQSPEALKVRKTSKKTALERTRQVQTEAIQDIEAELVSMEHDITEINEDMLEGDLA